MLFFRTSKYLAPRKAKGAKMENNECKLVDLGIHTCFYRTALRTGLLIGGMVSFALLWLFTTDLVPISIKAMLEILSYSGIVFYLVILSSVFNRNQTTAKHWDIIAFLLLTLSILSTILHPISFK